MAGFVSVDALDSELGPHQICVHCRHEVWWDNGMWRCRQDAGNCYQGGILVGAHVVEVPILTDPEAVRAWLRG